LLFTPQFETLSKFINEFTRNLLWGDSLLLDTKGEKKLPPYMLMKKFFCMNEDRRLKLDKFETYQDAMAATKNLVDKFLLEHYAPGMISHGTLRR
jgi:hypothetical protein